MKKIEEIAKRILTQELESKQVVRQFLDRHASEKLLALQLDYERHQRNLAAHPDPQDRFWIH